MSLVVQATPPHSTSRARCNGCSGAEHRGAPSAVPRPHAVPSAHAAVPRAQGAADCARSRYKTGLPALEGDEDLIAYYYICLHPNTAQGKDRRQATKGKERREIYNRLKETFGEQVQDFVSRR